MSTHQETLVLFGLGDKKAIGIQNSIIAFLNKRRPEDAKIHVFETSWQTAETYSDKRARLSTYIALHPNVKVVYGISAGASLAMSLVPELKNDTEYHFVSGKLLRPETIDSERNARAPALYDSVVSSQALATELPVNDFSMHCHVGYLDGVLAQEDMRIPGVPVHRIPMVNHTATILLAYATILRKL